MELSASNLPPHYLLTRSSIKVRLENRTNAIGSSNRLGSAAATGVVLLADGRVSAESCHCQARARQRQKVDGQNLAETYMVPENIGKCHAIK